VTTWNASDKGPAIVLSNGDLTATQTNTSGGTQPSKLRATDAGSVGKFFEVTANVTQGSGAPDGTDAVGVSTTASNVLITNDATNSIMYFASGWLAGPTTGGVNTGITWTGGDIIGVYYDSSSSIKFYKNGTLVYTYSGTIPSGGIFPTAVLFVNNDQVTANFGATTFAHLPSGASAWDVAGGSLPTIHASAAQTMDNFTQLAYANTGGTTTPPVFGTGGYFPDTIAAILAGRTVRCDFLVFLDFLTTPMRVWQGFGTLHTLDGNDWKGIGQLGKIGDLESSIGGSSPLSTFTLSGVDADILAAALNEDEEINNRDINVYMQFFDENFTPLDNPYVIWAGLMDRLRVKQNVETITVELSAETIFARRALAPLGNLGDREQQQFFPGDTGLSGIPSLMSKVAIWPVILPGFP
jgi:hypothetical protein